MLRVYQGEVISDKFPSTPDESAVTDLNALHNGDLDDSEGDAAHLDSTPEATLSSGTKVISECFHQTNAVLPKALNLLTHRARRPTAKPPTVIASNSEKQSKLQLQGAPCQEADWVWGQSDTRGSNLVQKLDK